MPRRIPNRPLSIHLAIRPQLLLPYLPPLCIHPSTNFIFFVRIPIIRRTLRLNFLLSPQSQHPIMLRPFSVHLRSRILLKTRGTCAHSTGMNTRLNTLMRRSLGMIILHGMRNVAFAGLLLDAIL